MNLISTRPRPKGGHTHVPFVTIVLMLAAGAACLLFPSDLSARQKPAKSYTIQIPPEPDYSSISWMLGVWAGKTNEKRNQGRVLLSVSYELGKRLLVLREELSLPATKDAPATHNGVMGILHPSAGGGFEMTLYSSNGFISRYRVTAKHGEIDLSPEGGALPPPGWLFRRTFRHTNPGECMETVDVAPPGSGFFNYYTADLFQVTPAPAAPAKTPKPANGSAGDSNGAVGASQ